MNLKIHLLSKHWHFGFIIFFLLCTGLPQIQAQQHRIISLANTIDIGDEIYYEHLDSYLGTIDGSFSIIINGDISNSVNSQSINLLLETLRKSKAKNIIIIPGDRDWANSGNQGWQKVNDLEKKIEKSAFGSNILWPLDKACPGPEIIHLSPDLSLITINTQWFNHPHDKPEQEDGICTISTEGDFLEELEDLIEENADKNVLVAGHYPLISLGRYGGFFPVSKWLFPVPIVSGMITSYKQNVGNSTDLINENYQDIRVKIGLLLSQY